MTFGLIGPVLWFFFGFFNITLSYFVVLFSFQDTFDVQILMARSVKHCINFKEVKEEELHRLITKITKIS